MPLERRAPCLTTAVLGGALLLSGCLSKPITNREAGSIISASGAFTRPKFAHIPRLLTFQSYSTSAYGQEGLLSITDLAKVDPTLAILKLERVVSVSESIYGPGRGAMHQLVVTPSGIDSTTLMADESPRSGAFDQQEELDAQEERRVGATMVSYNSFKKEIGWRVAIGTREFIQVDQIHNWRDANENIPVNQLAVDFTWHWMPNDVGDAFDSRSATFHSFPDEVQTAAASWGVRMNTEVPMRSRAYLQREGKQWQLVVIQWNYGRGNPR
ncbi:MAG TPA: hypothetical protein VGJ18_24770 [Gemmatimonadaceae bacterium]|jgi:hypothetical protein